MYGIYHIYVIIICMVYTLKMRYYLYMEYYTAIYSYKNKLWCAAKLSVA